MKYLLGISISLTTLWCSAQYQGGTGGGGAFSCGVEFQILPVELLHFTATPTGHTIHLEWTTATELNNAGFHVERSADGFLFDVIAEVPGAGTSQLLADYGVDDNAPLPSLSYYRLRQTDFDGSATWSWVVAVQLEDPQIHAFPNPVHSVLTISGVVGSGKQLVEVIDQKGQRLAFNVFPEGLVQVDMASFPAGLYHVRLSCGTDAMSWRVVKE